MAKKKKADPIPDPKTMDCPKCLARSGRLDSVCLDYYGDGTYFCQDCGAEWSAPEWERIEKSRDAC